jgi:DNA-binding MurR/RpiR family transcriptional regulator
LDAKSRGPEGGPPRTLEDLRKLAVGIGRDEVGISLGAKAHEVLAKLVDLPEQAAVRSIVELAELLDVNASTLTRLAKRLGYAGFGDLQAVFRNVIADDRRYFYSRQAGTLLSVRPHAGDETEVFSRLAQETAGNVEGFLGQLEPDVLRATARLLVKAHRVRIHGVRQFHALASFMTYGLGMLRRDVALLDAPRLGVAEAIAQLEPGDVVVVASCAPYTRSVARVAQVAAARGLNVVAITDTRSSPLVSRARHAFFVPHASSFFSNSMGAYIVFCEGLLSLVAREMGDEALAALASRDQLFEDLQVELR